MHNRNCCDWIFMREMLFVASSEIQNVLDSMRIIQWQSCKWISARCSTSICCLCGSSETSKTIYKIRNITAGLWPKILLTFRFLVFFPAGSVTFSLLTLKLLNYLVWTLVCWHLSCKRVLCLQEFYTKYSSIVRNP